MLLFKDKTVLALLVPTGFSRRWCCGSLDERSIHLDGESVVIPMEKQGKSGVRMKETLTLSARPGGVQWRIQGEARNAHVPFAKAVKIDKSGAVSLPKPKAPDPRHGVPDLRKIFK